MSVTIQSMGLIYLLREATPTGPTGMVWDVTIIRAGWSQNGRYYSEGVLERAVPMFEGTPVHALEWVGHHDHLPDRARDQGLRTGDFLRNRVGTLENVRFVPRNGASRGYLEARLTFWRQSADLAADLRDEWRKGRKDGIGLSIDAGGSQQLGMAEGRHGRIVTEFEYVESTDLVSYPAAGGRFNRLVASRCVRGGQENTMNLAETLLALRKFGLLESVNASWTDEERRAKIAKVVDGVLNAPMVEAREKLGHARFAERVELLVQARDALANGDSEAALALINQAIAEYQQTDEPPADPPPAPPEPPIEGARTPPSPAPPAPPRESGTQNGGRDAMRVEFEEEIARHRAVREAAERQLGEEQRLFEETRAAARRQRHSALVESRLSAENLPAATLKRLRTKLLAVAGGEEFSEATITEEVAEEREYLASVSTGHEIRGLGANRIDAGVMEHDRFQAALDGMLEGVDVGVEFVREEGTGRRGSKLRIRERDLMRESKWHGDPEEIYPGWRVAGWKGEKVKRFTSLHEAYAALRSGAGRGYYRPNVSDMMLESRRYVSAVTHGSRAPELIESVRGGLRESRFAESIEVSDWGQALGDSITRKMMREYTLDDLNRWRWIVSEIGDVKDFRVNRRVRMGGFGVYATVAEGVTYPTAAAGVPADEEATYSVAKRGLLEDLTWETFVNDDIGAVRRIPIKLARGAIQTLFRFVYDFLLNNSLVYDGVALAAAGHGNNISNSALDAAELTTARSTMRQQTAFGDASDVLDGANEPKWLVVPAALEDTAFRLATSEIVVGATNNAGTEPNLHRGIRPIINAYWDTTDADNWWVVADEMRQNTIEMGFLNGNEDPELFVQDEPTVGSVFTADRMTYKVRFVFGGAVLDFRPFFGGIV